MNSSTQISTDNTSLTEIDVSVDTQDLDKKRDTVKISVQYPLNHEKSWRKEKPYQKFRTLSESTNKSVNRSSSAARDTADFDRIIDNIITNNSKPRNSVTIKRETNKISPEKINIKHRYALHIGGVAFHFKA